MTDKRKDCPMRHENGNCTVAGGFCTAVNDPICEALHNAFNCGYRSTIRKQDHFREVTKKMDPMTNADRINAMTIEEKAEFLSSIAYGRETPWSEPFARKLCDSCLTVHGTYESGVEDDFHECDFVDGKCPHGIAIVWWLQQPAEEETL